jgi:hypothetical protein
MNKPLLLKVADAIEANPQHFDMSLFTDDCDTTACIAGWAVFLNSRYKNFKKFLAENDYSIPTRAASALKLTDDQASRLFYTEGWPARKRVKYRNAPTLEAKAKVATDYIRQYVARAAK